MKLHILRDGQELGTLADTDARELLEAGFLRPTDEFWVEQPDQRQALAILLEQDLENRPNWLARAKASVTTAGQTVQTQAANITGKLSSIVRSQQAAVTASATLALEGYLPQLRKMVNERLGKMLAPTQSALRDEVFLRKLFGAVYDCLPKPVGRFVTEIGFVEFCLKHRNRLLRQ
jgi:hypothetical protein